MATYTPDRRTPAGRFAIVASQFNAFIVDRLVEGAKDAFRSHGVADENVDVAFVPGALELPLIADRLASTGQFAAIVCLGAIIEGETSHYDVVVNQSAAGIADVALRTKVPVMNAILTTHNLDQAINRAGGKAGNKGFEVAVAAIEMANLLNQFPRSAS